MKNKKIFALLLCAVFAVTVSVLASGCSQEKDSPPPSGQSGQSGQSSQSGQSGQSAQNAGGSDTGTAAELGSLKSFSAGTLDGGTFTQDDIAAKDVTAINFWSLTCGPCIIEMPDLAAFAAALPENVQLVTVCLDGLGNEETAKSILEESGFTGFTLISGDGDLAALCGNLMYTPTTIFADAGGSLIGDAVIGGQEDLSGTFLAAVNKVLVESGKAEISLEE